MNVVTGLLPGFADPVLDAQRVFRGVMEALARPGSLQPLADLPEVPAPLTPELAAIALALADADAPLWLDAPLAGAPAVAEFLRFHTGAPIVKDPAEAAFALVADPATFSGAASAQVRAVADRIAAVVARHPDAGTYTPAPIL